MHRHSFGAARAEAETALDRHERECRERTERQHREMLAFQQEMRAANAQLRAALDLVNQRRAAALTEAPDGAHVAEPVPVTSEESA